MTYGWAGGSTRAWRRRRRQKLDANPLCEPCRRNGKVTAAVEVHHRQPLSEGGDRMAWDNLESVCADCHDQAHRPVRGCDPSGFPRSPDHPWNRSDGR